MGQRSWAWWRGSGRFLLRWSKWLQRSSFSSRRSSLATTSSCLPCRCSTWWIRRLQRTRIQCCLFSGRHGCATRSCCSSWIERCWTYCSLATICRQPSTTTSYLVNPASTARICPTTTPSIRSTTTSSARKLIKSTNSTATSEGEFYSSAEPAVC